MNFGMGMNPPMMNPAGFGMIQNMGFGMNAGFGMNPLMNYASFPSASNLAN